MLARGKVEPHEDVIKEKWILDSGGGAERRPEIRAHEDVERMSGAFLYSCLRWDTKSHRRAGIARSFAAERGREDGDPGVKGLMRCDLITLAGR